MLRSQEMAPSISLQNYELDITIRIHQQGHRYKADIFGPDKYYDRLNIKITHNMLETLNKQLRKALSGILGENFTENEKLAKAELEAQLRPLSEAGHFAFKQIFKERDTWKVIQDWLASGKGASINIIAEDFSLPWELLYHASVRDAPLSYEHFWGMRHIIFRFVDSNRFPSIIDVDPRPKLGLLTYNDLPAVKDKAIPFFTKLKDANEIILFRLDALDNERRLEGFEKFIKFWKKDFHLVHFACHASQEDFQPFIELSNHFRISQMDMENYGFIIEGHPLIFLNACETGSNLNPLHTWYLAAYFLAQGARGVIATECAVPDGFAADFAKELYNYLLAGKYLGESLLITRQHFLKKHFNPSGLLYSLYASPSIHIVTPQQGVYYERQQ